MAFSSSLEFGYVVLGLFFPFPNSQSNWLVRLRCLIAADTDRRSYSPLPPGTMSSILFAKHVSFEHSVSSPRPVITSRREEKNNKAKVFQHPIDSQSASSCLISPHFAAGPVGVGRGAASFLATESTGTVLIPRLMTRIAGHERIPSLLSCSPSVLQASQTVSPCCSTAAFPSVESRVTGKRHL